MRRDILTVLAWALCLGTLLTGPQVPGAQRPHAPANGLQSGG